MSLQATRVREDIADRSIDVQVLRLRRKLKIEPDAPRIIETGRGVGYIFTAIVKPFWTAEIGRLIWETSIANALWGTPRIHGELLKLGCPPEYSPRRHTIRLSSRLSGALYYVCKIVAPSRNPPVIWRLYADDRTENNDAR